MKKENLSKKVFWQKRFLTLILFSLVPAVALPVSPIQKNECMAPILVTDQISRKHENFVLKGWQINVLKGETFIWISGAIDSMHLKKEVPNQFDQLKGQLENYGINFSDISLSQNISCTTFQVKQELKVP
jgi:hypothetical protein